ncbi:MAG: hypothetical protein R6U58_01405 [Bacteroidales bacterium]
MELIPKKLVTIHLIDDNFTFTDDFREKYSWKNKYSVKYYLSTDKFFKVIEDTPLSVKGNNIVILAVNMAKPDKNLKSGLINKLISFAPDADIINICHEKEIEKGVSSLRNGNLIHIVNNENTLLRIDNAIKWVLAKTNLDNKYRNYKITLWLFVASIVITALFFSLFFLTG